MKSALSDFILGKKGIYGILHIIILLMSLFLVISISIDTFKGIPFIHSPRTWKSSCGSASGSCSILYWSFFWQSISGVIYGRTLSFAGGDPLSEHHCVLRVDLFSRSHLPTPVYSFAERGYALAIVVGWLTYNRASSLFVSYLTMLLATVYFASLAFFVLEHKVNPLVTDYGDALWWAFMDVTTVGSNIIAMTTTGRVLSVLLAALGMMMFPIFTVYITNLIQQSNQKKKQYYAEEEEKTAPAQGT